MYSLTEVEFEDLVDQGYNRIPVITEVLADLDTPLSTFLKLCDQPFSYLFESVEGGERWGRYSIIGLPARKLISINDHTVSISEQGKVIEQYEVANPLDEIERLQQMFKVPDLDNMPRFTGGLVGYFAYDTVRFIEPQINKTTKPDPMGCPDIMLIVSEEVIVFDNLKGKLYLIIQADPSINNAYHNAKQRLAYLAQQLIDNTVKVQSSSYMVDEAEMKLEFSCEDYKSAVADIQRYIRSGDVLQVVLSQRLALPFTDHPINYYRALRCLNPSPYLYFMNFDQFQIIGSSPEILVRSEKQTDKYKVTLRPIAGTRPRGSTEQEDQQLEQELSTDPKELAEHLMLIDLGRNDLGRIAEIGSVELTQKMVIERYSHVMHIVSNVTGTLKPNISNMDVLRATFPAGTVSGAPKVRAMEIIDDLEPTRRGIYAGAIGYLSWNGNIDTAIAIRTAVIKDQTLYIQAGAGIVADSDPDREWEETLNKVRVLLRAAQTINEL